MYKFVNKKRSIRRCFCCFGFVFVLFSFVFLLLKKREEMGAETLENEVRGEKRERKGGRRRGEEEGGKKKGERRKGE